MQRRVSFFVCLLFIRPVTPSEAGNNKICFRTRSGWSGLDAFAFAPSGPGRIRRERGGARQYSALRTRNRSGLAGAGPLVGSEGIQADIQNGRAKLSASGGPGGSDGEELYEYETETFSDEEMQQIMDGAPPKSVVIQQLMGINVFTYILAALIVFFLGGNQLLGPGWLGQIMGLEGTGTFTEVSPSLPLAVPLNNPENFLNL